MHKLKIALIGACGMAFMVASTMLVSGSPGGAKAKTEMFDKMKDGHVSVSYTLTSPVLDVAVHTPELPAAAVFNADHAVIKLPVVKEISLLKRPGWQSKVSDNLQNRDIDIRRKPPLIV